MYSAMETSVVEEETAVEIMGENRLVDQLFSGLAVNLRCNRLCDTFLQTDNYSKIEVNAEWKATQVVNS